MKEIRIWRIVLILALLSGLLSGPFATQWMPPARALGSDAVDVWYGATPVINGVIAPGEYAGANVIHLAGYGGTVIIYVRHDTNNLYVAFDLPDTTPFPTGMGGPGPAVQVFLDTNNDQATAPQADDYRLTVTKGNTTSEDVGDGSGWGGPPTGGWAGVASSNATGWHAEFSISFAKLGITPGTAKTFGFCVANVWTLSWPLDYYWPAGGDWLQPDSWGQAYSSENWDSWYFKSGGWTDYAPSGVPDFDQKQDNWGTGPRWTYCGPVAAANSLWWFDSKFEPQPQPPSLSVVNDHYPLVQTYGSWDDHYISNVIPLVDDLANYCGTSTIAGTNVYSMSYGLTRYIYDHGLYDDYHVTLAVAPTFDWVAQEVMRSEDVILLLGFYEWTGFEWRRVGGHYVTVAGADSVNMMIAFSDPFVDNAEIPGPGRVLSGTLVLHSPIPGHGAAVHNDAGNVSHDFYPVISTSSPGGTWGPGDYPVDPNFFEQNPHPDIPTEPSGGFPIQTEVEFAIAVSPFTWKPGDWEDYAPSCLPDFGQKQDQWGVNVPPWKWTYCGPVALANNLWYYDSRFEPAPVPPPTVNDNYPLVAAYGAWDDHDARNVDDPAVTPSTEFVKTLAHYLDTDGQRTAIVHSGTYVTDVQTGLVQWLTDRGLAEDFTVTRVVAPTFRWTAEETERCEVVVLLLGFWQEQPAGSENWVRLGGHYVAVAGIDFQSGLIGFSDSCFDRAEQAWPWLGRVYPIGVPHGHPAVPPDPIHNDAKFLSHDVYCAVVTPSPGGTWGLEGYATSWTDIENFWGQNGTEGYPTPTGDPIWTEVEGAVALSPTDPDPAIAKSVTPTTPVLPGDWITYTVHYSNPTSNWATAVVITDEIPAYLAPGTVAFTYSTNHGVITATDTYVWDVGTLKYRQGGTITVTGQVDPAITVGSLTFTNTATIAATADRDPSNDSASAAVTVLQPVLTIVKTDAPDPVLSGGVLTYTLTVQNTGGANATGVTITDTIPANTAFRSADSGGSKVGSQVQWTGKTVNVSGSLTVRFSVTVSRTRSAFTITNATYGVACAEGASTTGSPVATSVKPHGLYLPLVLKGH